MGSLLYISRMTKPDISFIMNLLGQRTSDPSPTNLAVAWEVCKYLSSTIKDGITIVKRKTKEGQIKGYIDASQPREEEGSRCQLGSLVTLYGMPVMWTTRRQDVVAMSITEAEYIAMSEGLKDLAWIRQLLQEIMPHKGPWIPTMFTDNEAAQKLSKVQVYHRRTRHILHRFHYIRQEVDNQLATIQRVPGKENPADIFTKILPMSTVKSWKTSCMKSEIG